MWSCVAEPHKNLGSVENGHRRWIRRLTPTHFLHSTLSKGMFRGSNWLSRFEQSHTTNTGSAAQRCIHGRGTLAVDCFAGKKTSVACSQRPRDVVLSDVEAGRKPD